MQYVAKLALFFVVISFLMSFTLADTPGGLPPERSLHPGEWEDMRAQLIGWSSSLENFFCEIVDHTQEYNEVWIIVRNQSEEDMIRDALTLRGIPHTNVIFLREEKDSIWSRDFGPLYLRTPTGEARITDVKYYWTRPADDVIPFRLGMREELPVHEALLTLEGGNFQSDGHGYCFCTDGVLDANSSMTQEEIEQIFYDYLGCTRLTILGKLEGNVVAHIDMFAKMLTPTKWIAGEYPDTDPNYQVLEDNAALLASLTAHNGEPYEVIRIPMPPTTPTTLTVDYGDLLPRWDETKMEPGTLQNEVYRTHTNASIADGIVLVPTYNMGTDEEALQIFQNEMPDHTIVSIYSEEIIPMGGAIHCVMMEIPEYPTWEGLAFDSIQNLTEAVGNGNGTIDPGETWEFQAVLENRGSSPASSPSARIELHSSASSSVTILKDRAEYGDIPSGSTGASLTTYAFALDESYSCAEPILFNLVEINSSLGINPDQYQCLSLNVGDETVVTRFWDNMEFGAGGWTHGSVGGASDLWHQQTDPGCFLADSPTTQWSFVEDTDCDYSTGVRSAGYLTSQTISGITSASKLYFDYWRETDSCYPVSHPMFAEDYFRLDVSDDGFSTSTTLIDFSCLNPAHAQWIADGPYDLSDYAGSSVQVRFIFDSDTPRGNLFRGIGIDDVLVEDRTYSCEGYGAPLPGEVPHGPNAAGELLTMSKSGSDLIISWDIGCNATYSTDYAVYRGNISTLAAGSWDHAPVTCTDAGGDLTETIAADTGSYYYIVVPHDGVVEGNCGVGTPGARPNSGSACYPAGGGSCL
jgi:agmatine deiminase